MIAQSETERRIRSLIEAEAEGMGLALVRIRMSGGQRPILQIMIERAGGAPTNVEDCARFSRRVSAMFEELDPISDAYVLEVSTPGIDRPLTRPGDFARWEGHLAKSELRYPLEGRRRFVGVIAGEEAGAVRLELDDGESEMEVRFDELSKAVLVLTDELIEAARVAGNLPPQPDDDGALDGFEVEAIDDDAQDEDDADTSPDTH